MSPANSPLRYPGGKAVLSGFLAQILSVNHLEDGVYVEPFAGGAGAAFDLLFREYIQRIVLNDADPCIYAFWHTVLNNTEELVKKIRNTSVTIDEWYHQREVYTNYERHTKIDVSFAVFFLNRCNRSGILVKAGPIGGKNQTGKWKIDARFNKDELVRRIEKIRLYRDRISINNEDAIVFLNNTVESNVELEKTLVYLDPPYYIKGSELYLNYYEPCDHILLANFIKQQTAFKWIMTYDDVPEIRSLYQEFMTTEFQPNYSVNHQKKGKEILIYGPGVMIPVEEDMLMIMSTV